MLRSMDALISAATAHLAATLDWFAARAPGGQVERRDGLQLVAGPHTFPGAYFNAAVRTDPALDPTRAIATARAFFEARGRIGLLWTTDGSDADLEAAATRQGLQPTAWPGSPGMALERPPAIPFDLPPNLGLEVVEGPTAAQRFARLVAVAFEAIGNPIEATLALLGNAAAFGGPNAEGLLLSADGRDVATAFALDSHDLTGLYWIAVDPAVHRRGYGRLATQLAIQRAATRGARTVVLQATPFGEPLYRALGFRTFTHYRRYRLERERQLS